MEDEDLKPACHGEEEDCAVPPDTYHVVDKREFFQPSIQFELDSDDTKHAKRANVKIIHVKGWKINNEVIAVMQRCVLDKLTTLNLWNAGMTEDTFNKLAEFMHATPTVQTVAIEGNAIPDSEPFADLIGKSIRHLSLRNNEITDMGAKKIGEALGSPHRVPPDLENLNLAFNRISDEGAIAIANGLRMNRSLVSLSLASNRISDRGAKALADCLNTFLLSHEEVVARRKMMSHRVVIPRTASSQGSKRGARSGSNRGLQVDKNRLGTREKSKTGEKPTKRQDKVKKDTYKTPPKTPTTTARAKANKSGGRGRLLDAGDTTSPDLSDQSHPLLGRGVESLEGKIWMPGCNTLLSLNLARNRIGSEGLKCLLRSIRRQESYVESEDLAYVTPGLLKLSLNKNVVPHDDELYLELFHVMRSKNPLLKNDISVE